MLHSKSQWSGQADFLQQVPENLVENLAESSCIHEFFVEPSTSLFEFGSTGVTPATSKRFLSSDHRHGWFLVVRGMVRKLTRSEVKTCEVRFQPPPSTPYPTSMGCSLATVKWATAQVMRLMTWTTRTMWR